LKPINYWGDYYCQIVCKWLQQLQYLFVPSQPYVTFFYLIALPNGFRQNIYHWHSYTRLGLQCIFCSVLFINFYNIKIKIFVLHWLLLLKRINQKTYSILDFLSVVMKTKKILSSGNFKNIKHLSINFIVVFFLFCQTMLVEKTCCIKVHWLKKLYWPIFKRL
jgi:hypothetical protein